jgi:hypothetical protein
MMCLQNDCPLCELEDERYDLVAPVADHGDLEEFQSAQMGPPDSSLTPSHPESP